MAPDTSTSTSEYGLGSPEMLAKIDKLFACGVGELVKLPQIIVVGDQSSGKSSVLEALIKQPLPRDSGLCTRFATQIMFNRSVEACVSVSIKPDLDGPEDRQERLRAWTKALTSLDSKAFADTMKEVHDVMGLAPKKSNARKPKPTPTFCTDVLRLEISGPTEEHFSVIDIPGIFRDTTEGLTTDADIVMVKSMVESYMKNVRSVILAVIPANVDLATQDILKMARDFDPNQDRTLGVITKPDLVDEGAEDAIMDRLKGHAQPMKLGWHVIRNPGQKELSDTKFDRNSNESKFFRTKAPWKSLDKTVVGVDALRVRLKDVLSSVVKREFPKVHEEIKKRLLNSEKRLSDLGPERNDPAAQLGHLISIAMAFQSLVASALIANHGANDAFLLNPELRLCSAAMDRMRTFSEEMTKFGHKYGFLTERSAVQEASTPSQTARDQPDKTFNTRKVDDIDRIQGILHPQSNERFPAHDSIYEWLRTVYKDNRGFEMGTFNAAILKITMKEQSSKWANISSGCVSDIIVIVHRFIETALKCACADGNVRNELMKLIFDKLVEGYREAINQLEFILEVENDNTPLTMNDYFNEELRKIRRDDVVASIKKNDPTNPHHSQTMQPQQAVPARAMHDDDYKVQDIHDQLKSFYNVSKTTFVDTMCKQVVMRFLLSDERGPLALLSPYFISQLSSEQLESIVGEDAATKKLRAHLTKEVESLKNAKKVLGPV